MSSAIKLLSELKRGQRAIIDSFTDYETSLKLLEMGCIPGAEVKMNSRAPFGCPITIIVNDYTLSLRLEEAATILVKS